MLQGQGVDQDLCDLGVRQARALAEHLADQPISAVYASPLRRARQTAEIVASRFGLEPEVVVEIQEADAGLWEGLSWEEIRARWPVEQAAHDADPGAHGYPGGESFCDVRDRSAPALESLAGRHPGRTVLAVAHNVVNRAVLAHWTGIPIQFSRRIPQNNAAYNVVVFPRGAPKVRTLNAAAHLAGLIPPD